MDCEAGQKLFFYFLSTRLAKLALEAPQDDILINNPPKLLMLLIFPAVTHPCRDGGGPLSLCRRCGVGGGRILVPDVALR